MKTRLPPQGRLWPARLTNITPVSHPELQTFFYAYAASAFGDSAENTAVFYSPNFVFGGPAGSAVFANDIAFIEWLRGVREFNQKVGMKSIEVIAIGQPVELSPAHLLVSVQWGAQFTRLDDRLIEFRISYLLERIREQWKILAYIAEKDQMEEMRALGLI